MMGKVRSWAKINVKTSANVGFVMICVLSLLTFFFLHLRGFQGMDPRWTFNVGIDGLGIVVCLIIFFSCVQGSNLMEEQMRSFAPLLVVNAFGLFLDACRWFVQGIPSLSFWNLIVNALLYGNSYTMLALYWKYVHKALKMNENISRLITRLLSVLYIPSCLLAFLSIFFPICFSIDANGFYQKERFFLLSLLYLLLVIPPFIYGLVTSISSKKEKLITLQFFLLPIVIMTLSIVQFGNSSLASAELLAILQVYAILVMERSKKITAAQTEMQMAANIQSSMMPHTFPPFPEATEFDIYAEMDPAKDVGGDFYDFYMIDPDHLCLVIADVAGKGVPASLFMMISKIVLQNCAKNEYSTAKILTIANEVICENNPEQMFVTVWIGILEISTGKITASNAGHEYPALKHPGGKFELLKDKHGIVIGGMKGIKYREYELQLEPGEKIFVYTDGVPEASDINQQMFGIDRMIDALNADPDADPRQLLKNIRQHVDDFVKDAEQFDDLTMLCLEYRGPDHQEKADAAE